MTLRGQNVRNRTSATLLICVWATSLALSGCGASHTKLSPAAKLCRPSARDLVAHTVGLRVSRITTIPATGNNAEPQCTFRTHLAGGGRFDVTVNVDNSPQPYTVLSRTIVEGQQVFSPTRLTPAPVAVLHLGLLASWFPGPSHLMSTDGVRLVTTTVIWSGAKQGTEIRFATRISRLYLGKPKPALAHGAPAGG
jgi:hypothetical protein